MLLQQPEWKDGIDGRASEAMLGLLISIRELRKSYPGFAIVAFDAPLHRNRGRRTRRSDAALPACGGNSEAYGPDLILAGNAHAMQAPEFGYDAAAMYLGSL